MATQSWVGLLHQRIAVALRNARRGKWTAEQLAEKTHQLGYPLTRSKIANYESGRTQSLDVAELLVLAAALEVPALSLLFPGRPDQQIELLPGVVVSSLDAMRGFVGDTALWPHREVAALIEQLGSISAAMGGSGQLESSVTSRP